MSSAGRSYSGPKKGERSAGSSDSHPTVIDFLQFPASVRFNLRPADDGTVTASLADFTGAQFIEIVVADTDSDDVSYLPLAPTATPTRDRRIARPLSQESHHIPTRFAAALKAGAEAEIENLLDADWRAFTTLAEVYEFLVATSGDPRLREFHFLTQWPELDEKQKLDLLAKHHCHEFHLFLSRKDPKFFGAHVAPFLRAKPEPQFLDDYLLKRDLTPYLRPFAFSRLNAAEKALLAQANPKPGIDISSELNLRWKEERPSPEAETILFSQTLRGADLSPTDSLGLASNRPHAFMGNYSSYEDADFVGSMDTGMASGVTYLTEKLRSIVIPSINFEDITLGEAIDFLRMRSKELDTFELDPAKKGVNMVVRSGNMDSICIPELRLQNVPLAVALKYISDMTKMRYKVDDYAVTFVPLTESDDETLFTRTFRVPPDFAGAISASAGSSGSTDFDPFAEQPGGVSPDFIKERVPIAELLENAGIRLPAGATATLSNDGRLVVTTTASELDKVEALTTNVGMDGPDMTDPSLILDLDEPQNTHAPETFSQSHQLRPYGVIQVQLAFYFPAPGDYPAYPFHVSEGDTVLAHAAARTLRVTDDPAPEDATSWSVVARDGTNNAVLQFLSAATAGSVELDAIHWRLKDRGFFLKLTKLLRKKLWNDPEVFSYAVLHDDPTTLPDFIENTDFAYNLGEWFSSKLIQIRPEVHHGWETKEFDPLVNPRAHAFGDNPRLSHSDAQDHYEAFLDTLIWKPVLSANDQLTFTYFLFLQNRIAEALERFTEIQVEGLPDRLQYDYLHSLVLFHRNQPQQAKEIADGYLAKLPPGLWRDRFFSVVSQANEIATPIAAVPDKKANISSQLELSQDPDQPGTILLQHANLRSARIRLFHIDLEVLFSNDPFLEQGTNLELPPIAPNLVVDVPLPVDQKTTAYELPESFRKGNILVAAKSEDIKRLRILDSQLIETRVTPIERTIQVIDPATNKSLAATYIKVYAETHDGEIEFHKDGYTDLRGKFDYLSHTGTDPNTVKRLALFVSHPEKGSLTRTITR